MDDRERLLIDQWYKLQLALYEQQKQEIDALISANREALVLVRALEDAFHSLRASHETVGKMLKLSKDFLRSS